MDATEAVALKELTERDKWSVDELPAATGADILRCLDGGGMAEACKATWVQPPNTYFGDTRPLVLSLGPWFSPIEQRIAWAEIFSAPPLGAPKLGDWSYLIRASERGRLKLARHDSEQPAELADGWSHQLPPLTPTEQWVFDLICKHPDGIPGKQIIATAKAEGFVMGELSTLTRHIIPKLKELRGVKNRSGAGYYLPT